MKFEMKMKLNEWIKIRIEKVKVYDIDKVKVYDMIKIAKLTIKIWNRGEIFYLNNIWKWKNENEK